MKVLLAFEVSLTPWAIAYAYEVAFLRKACRLSPRPISIRQLHALLHFHLEPINLVVYKGSYILGNLILRGASRLDAFSAYPLRT
jgi:hypothetical protein